MILGSRRHGARFGIALANIGDLNMDGYEDIAVGAPYEGNGVVYIYHGSVDGIKYEPAQIIQAENIDPQIKGFGISLSKGADVDGNHYNDIAVGAFKSGHAVVLKSHPIITFKPTLNTSTRSVSRKAFNFSCTSCLSYTGWSVPDTVDAKVTLQVDLSFGRANFISNEFRRTNTHAYNITLRRGKQWCKDLRVQNTQIVYRTEPLLLAMTYELTNNPNKVQPRGPRDSAADEFCMECPVLDSAQSTIITTMVAFETGCRSFVCTPDIKIDARFMGIEETFILGEKQTLGIRLEVENIGEPAFFTRVNLIIPKVTPVVEIPSICYDLSNQDRKETYVLVCDIGYPLEKNYTMDLVMSMKDVPAGTKTLTFKVNVTSAGNDNNPSDNHKELVLPIVIQADMTIAGIPSQDQIVYMTKGNTYIKDLTLSHTFQVWNSGPSTVETAEIEFQIPHQYVLPPTQEIFMRVLEPQLQTSASIMCTPVMGFSFWNPSSEIPTIDPNLSDGEGPDDDFYQLSNRRPPSLSKRSVSNTENREENFADSMPKVSVPDDAPSTSNFSMPPSKRTLFLNCTDPKVDCFTVKCSGGPFLPNKTQAVINFQLRPDFVVLESQLQMKDIILFSSMGTVTIRDPPDALQPQGHKPDYADVHTRFLGTIPEGSVATWIIVLAVICGILILLLIATALHKIGFFKREKKEELKALKDAEVVTNEEEDCTDFQADVISSDEL
ncbi:integrin alpha-9 isoform X2 [Cryptotermes secundus]|uniref:integrin alpha-9 isoform X2 n=1 Tax=Cryptotermes secundus TaxID=105785 RepID=UPI000CD7CD9D|nr:integrin alpha-9 isoform X2 [Cryptotermes secundus]